MKPKCAVLVIKGRIWVLTLLCLASLTVLFVFREQVGRGAMDGILLCGRVVIPSLFPFMFLADFISRTIVRRVLGRIISPLFYLLFGVKGECATSVLLSFVSGYPVSAKLINEQYAAGAISRQDAKRLMRFCVNPGPAFAVAAVGGTILGSVRAGVVIWVSVLLASVAVGMFSRPKNKESNPLPVPKEVSASEAFCESVASSARAVFSICAYTVLFAAFCAPLCQMPFAEIWLKPLLPVLEITNGISTLGRFPLPAFAAYISFGGLSVIFQILFFGRDMGLTFKEVVLSRGVCAAISAAVCRILLYFFPVKLGDIPAMGAAVRATQANFTVSACLVFSVVVFLAYLEQIFSKKNEII